MIFVIFICTQNVEGFKTININYKLEKMLTDVDIIFRIYKINYWIDGATLLNLFKNKYILNNLNFGEIGLLRQDLYKIYNIESQLTKIGYKLVPFYNGCQIHFKNNKNKSIINVYTYKLIDQQYFAYDDPYLKHLFPNNFYLPNELFPIKRIKINNLRLNIPNNPIHYLNRNFLGWDKNISENFEIIKEKPFLWLYWENKPGETMPIYIELCVESIYKHCEKSFNIIKLNEKTIFDYLPELESNNIDLSNLVIAQKVDYYRVFLLEKFGGLYLDTDVLVLKDPIEIIEKLKFYDYVGFGCTGMKCNNGYGRPSNWIMASRKNGKLINNILNNIEEKLQNNKKWEYYDLGKYIIWDEIDKLIKKQNYTYFQYSNDYDGTRDINGYWVTETRFFSKKPIIYKLPLGEMLFIVMYNSHMANYKKMNREELLNSDLNISKFFRKSLF